MLNPPSNPSPIYRFTKFPAISAGAAPLDTIKGVLESLARTF